jgi:hypothetical protein
VQVEGPDVRRHQYPDVAKHPDTCYCEAFKVEEVVAGAKGIRQGQHPEQSLRDRHVPDPGVPDPPRPQAKAKRSPRTSSTIPDSWIPEVYVFAVLFLGLGSMWLHASLSSHGQLVGRHVDVRLHLLPAALYDAAALQT